MKINTEKLLLLEKFFSIQESSSKLILHLKTPSTLLFQNIHYSWLKSIYEKSCNYFPIYLTKNTARTNNKESCGFICHHTTDNIKKIELNCKDNDLLPKNTLNFLLNVIVPQPDIMQCFIQWQRYRKYWWSSVRFVYIL